MDDPIENIYLNINPMKIMLKTNVGEGENDYQPFTYDMLYSELKDQVNEVDSKYPYFTSSVKLPYDLLFYRDYSYVLEFFFNFKKFQKVLMKNIVDYVDENAIYGTSITEGEDVDDETAQLIATFEENTEYNVQSMMKLLFPIRFTFDKAFSSTYRQLVLGEFNTNMIAFDPKNPLSEGATGMMTIDGNVYIVRNVVWVNDIVNHPIYNGFIVKYNNGINTKRGFESKMEVVYREKIMELMILLNILYPKTPPATSVTVKPDFFAELKTALENEIPSVSRNTYISNTLANKKQVLSTLLKELNYFVATANTPTPPPLKMVDSCRNIQGKILKTEVFKYIYDNEQIIADIVKHITRIYNTYYENNKTDSKVMLGSELNANLTKLYNACIAIKATKMVQSFVFGELRFLDMSEKNKDDTTKSKEERDVIGYISKYFGSFAKMSDNIVKSIDNIIPPIRETSNLLLRNEINKIRFKSRETTDPKLGDTPSCSRNKDFFRDVYNRYMLNRSQMPVNEAIMYTGVNTSTQEYVANDVEKTKGSEGNTTYEIYAVIDLVNKSYFESGKYRCELTNDDVTNEFNSLVYLRIENMLNTYRKYSNFNARFAKTGVSTKTNAAIENPPPPPQSASKIQGGKLLFEVLKNKKQYFKRMNTRKSILETRRVKNRNHKRTRRRK